jgi:hypothetical protein
MSKTSVDKTNKNIINNTNNKILSLIDIFLKKILEVEKESSTLEDKVNKINLFLDNLIDFCIKKKIYFYIEKNIGYSQIIDSFKLHLCKYLQKLIDPSFNIINKYIENLEKSENFDNYSDINSLLFRKFKSNTNTTTSSQSTISESKSKSDSSKNVSFREEISILGYDDSEGFDYNEISKNKIKKKLDSEKSSDDSDSISSSNSSNSNSSSNSSNSSNSSKSTNSSESNNLDSSDLDTDRLALYIKILLSQNKNIIEFIEKLTNMCKIISDPNIFYDKDKPFG